MLSGIVALTTGASTPASAHTLDPVTTRAAVQQFADSYAGQGTVLTTFFADTHTFVGQAEWMHGDSPGCPECEFDQHHDAGDRPMDRYHAIKLQAVCQGAHTPANVRQACVPVISVTEVLAPR